MSEARGRGRIIAASVVVPIAAVLVLLALHAKGEYTPCDRDSDCNEDYFCKTKPGYTYCQRCHNCTGRYRRLPARDGCARTADECGDCLSGFAAEELLDGSQKDICQPAAFPDPDEASSPSLPVLVPVVAAAAVAISLIVVLILCACVTRGWWKRQRVRVPTEDDDSGVAAAGSARYSRHCGEVAIDVQTQVELQPLTSFLDPPPYSSLPASAPPRALIEEDAAASVTIEASLSGIGSFGIGGGITNDRKCGADNGGRRGEGAEDRDADDTDAELHYHWRLEENAVPVHGGQVGEPIEDIWRLFEDVRDDNNGANEPILDEDTPAVMEDDDNYDPIEDLWRLFSDPPVADHEPNQPDLGDGDEHAHEMAVIDIQVARDPTQRPRAVSDASSRRNDSGIESSSPQSSNFSSVDALESSEINDDSAESNPQQRSETLSNTMPRSTRRRRANQNDTATAHTKKPRSS